MYNLGFIHNKIYFLIKIHFGVDFLLIVLVCVIKSESTQMLVLVHILSQWHRDEFQSEAL